MLNLEHRHVFPPHTGHDSTKYQNTISVASYATFSASSKGVIRTSAEQHHLNGVLNHHPTRHKMANKIEGGKMLDVALSL